MAEARWYVAHTYSGYENKVKADLEKTIENRGLQDEILEVSVPLEDVVEIKDGVKKTSQRKMFPGYVLVNMIMNDDTWYVVRNTRGVTGFVGPASKPVPLEPDEMARMGLGRNDVEIDLAVGDTIMVVSGAMEGTIAQIREINESKQTVSVLVEMFGRETPLELGFTEVKKM